MAAKSAIGPQVVVRLFRTWAAGRHSGEHPLPCMLESLRPFGLEDSTGPQLAVACASLFELLEARLGRVLEPECCCSRRMSRDERALTGLLRHAPELGQPHGTSAIPHGLPGAICWATFAVRRALNAGFGPEPAGEGRDIPPQRCPFGPPPVQRAMVEPVALFG